MLARFYQLFKVHVALTQNEVNFIKGEVFDGCFFVSNNVAGWYDTEELVAARVTHFL